MADPKPPPASQSLIEVSPQPVQSPPGTPGPQPERPLYTTTVSVFPNRVTVTGAGNGEKSQARTLFPGIAAVAYYPADVENPSLLVMVRKTPHSVIKDVKTWGAKWRDRTAALVLWVVFASYMFMPTGVVGRTINAITGRDAASDWEGLALLGLIAALLVAATFTSRKRALLAGLYVLFFPFVAFGVAFANVFNVLSFARLLFGTIGRFLLRGANGLLLLVACVAVNKPVPNGVLVGILVYLLLGALYIVITNFMWVTNPLGTLTTVADWASRLAFGSVKTEAEKLSAVMRQYDAASGPQRQGSRDEVLKLVDNMTSLMTNATSLADKTQHVSGRVVLFYLFTGRFLSALFLIVLVFGGIFRGIGKLLPGAFAGTNMASFWDAFYYSVVTFFTVGDGSITPTLFIAQAAIVCEVVFAVMTLTVLLLSFSTVSVEVAQANGRYIETKAREYVERAKAVLQTHWVYGDESPKEFYERLKMDFDNVRSRKKT